MGTSGVAPDVEAQKAVVRRLVDELMNQGHLEVIDELYAPDLARAARGWIEPFLGSFDDVEMTVEELVGEGDVVVGRFTCSGTHSGAWDGHQATGRRFRRVAEVGFFRFTEGRISSAWSLEDNLTRLRHLGLDR